MRPRNQSGRKGTSRVWAVVESPAGRYTGSSSDTRTPRRDDGAMSPGLRQATSVMPRLRRRGGVTYHVNTGLGRKSKDYSINLPGYPSLSPFLSACMWSTTHKATIMCINSQYHGYVTSLNPSASRRNDKMKRLERKSRVVE